MSPRVKYFPAKIVLLAVLVSASPCLRISASPGFEYLWFEAENMRGISETGVSAEWSQGGESEWNSVAASADETRGRIWQDIEVPRGGDYKIWVRYADWANKTENFVVRISQQQREVFRREFGIKDINDPHDETSLYWSWSFAWDGAMATSIVCCLLTISRMCLMVVASPTSRRCVTCGRGRNRTRRSCL